MPYCVFVYRGGVVQEPEGLTNTPDGTFPPAAAQVTPVGGVTLQVSVAVPPKDVVRFGVRVMTGAMLVPALEQYESSTPTGPNMGIFTTVPSGHV